MTSTPQHRAASEASQQRLRDAVKLHERVAARDRQHQDKLEALRQDAAANAPPAMSAAAARETMIRRDRG